jgi:hypothetical protein
MAEPTLQSIYDEPGDVSKLAVANQDSKTSEQAARVLRLEMKTGLPSDYIENNIDEVEKSSASDGFDPETFRKDSPKFASWMAQNPNHYSLAKDDKSFFSQAEIASDSFGRGWESVGKQEELAGILIKEMDESATNEEIVRRDKLKQEIGVPENESVVQYLSRQPGYGWAQATSTTGVAAIGAAKGAPLGAMAGYALAGVGAIPGFAAGATAGAASEIFMYSYNMESAFAYDEMRNMVDINGQPLNKNVAKTVARGVGVLNAIVETTSDAALMTLLPGVKNLVAGLGKNAAKNAIKEAARKALANPTTRQMLLSGAGKMFMAGGIEGSEEFVQAMVGAGGREVAQAASGQKFAPDSFTQDVSSGAQQARDAFFSTVLGPGLVFGGADMVSSVNKVREARETENWYKALGEGVKDSKAFKNLPDKAQEAMASIIKDGPYQNTYVDPKVWQEYWQSQNIDPREVAGEVMGDTESYDNAVAAGHDIVIPTERYARKIAPTEHNAFFSQEIRRSPESMNAREATTFFQSANEAANNENAQTPQEGVDLSQGVYDDVAGQLRSTGAYTERQSDAYAKTWQSIFRTMGQRSGQDPMALYEKYKPSIKKLDNVPVLSGNELAQNDVPVFKSSDQAIVYGDSIKGNPDMILALKDEMSRVDSQIKVLREKMAAGTTTDAEDQQGMDLGVRRQLLRESLQVAEGTETESERQITEMALKTYREKNALSQSQNFAKAYEKANALGIMRDILGGEMFGFLTPEGKFISAENYGTHDKLSEALGLGSANDATAAGMVRIGHSSGDMNFQVEVGNQAGYDQVNEAIRQNVASDIYGMGAPIMIDLFRGNGLEHTTEFTVQEWMDKNQDVRDFLPTVYQQPATPNRNLVAMHNLTAENLIFAEKMGGLPAPSLSIGKVEHPLDGFGEITLIGSRDLIDPKKKTNKVFNADIYSPRYPNVRYDLDSKKWKEARALVSKEEKDLDRQLGTDLDAYSFNHKGLDALRESAVVQLAFLRTLGQDIEIPRKEVRGEYIKLNPNIEQFIGRYDIPSDLYKNKDFLREYESLRLAVIKDAEDKSLAAGNTQEDATKDGQMYGEGWYDEDNNPNYNIIRNIQDEISQKAEAGKPDYYAAERILRDKISPVKMKFDEWVDNNFSDIIGKERLYNGEDRNYNTRYLPHTLENVVRVMKRELQSGEGFNYGLGNVRASVAKRYSSIKAIQADRSKILSKAAFEKAKEFTDEEFNKIIDEAYKVYADKKTMGVGDRFTDALIDGIKRHNIKGSLDEFGFKGMDLDRINAFLGVLRDMSTEYFEAKIQRAVSMNEFAGAVVPTGTRDKAIRVLERNNIPFIKYDPKIEGDRTRAINELSDKVDILFQDKSGPRGRIYFPGMGRQPNIDLFKNADLSTFMHESGHLYLEMLADLATAPNANEQIKADYQAVLNWFGVADRNGIKRDQHEQFARGFEAYLMEGKAPNVALRGAFMRFKIWLTRLYQQMTNLNVSLSPEVRGVFDRMIASDEEIKAAESKQNFQPLFIDPKKMGMNDEDAAKYLQATEEARINAEDELLRKMVNEILREEKTWWKEELAKIQVDVAAEAIQRPEYIAASILQKGQNPDGTPAAVSLAGLKINRKDISKFPNKNMLPRGISSDDGMPVGVVAELFGYASGEEFLNSLANAPAINDYVQGTSIEQMRQRHGEFLTNRAALESAAMKAIHNDKRAEVLRTELEYLAKNDMPVLKDVMRRVTRRMPAQEDVRIWAEETIARQKVRDVRPSVYQRAERNFARQAGEFLANGDLNAAFDAKLKELYNHELFRIALDAKDDVEESVYNFSKFFKSDDKIAKKRDMNLVNAGRAILAQFGIGKTDKTSFAYLDAVKNYDPEFFVEISDMVTSATQTAANYKDITYDDFTKMKNSVNALWDLAKRTRQILIDGKLMDREEALKELEGRLDVITTPQERAGYTRDVTTWDKTKMGLLGMRSALRRVESWVTAIDGGKQGAFRRFIWNPISESITAYREDKKGYLQKYLELARMVEKSITNEPIIARELVNKNGTPYTFSGKASLLHALLHTGNDSNLSKLLRGRGWGDFDEAGRLDTSKWDAFISRMQADGTLTKVDYDFAQGIWDLLEAMKPAAQKSHKDMYGYYFSEITATKFQNRFGEYRGGYVPAIADPFIVADAAMREEREAIEKSDNSFMFPTTGRGFSKARVEKYARPLALDLRYIPSHIDKVLRFTHIEPRIKDVGRIIMNKQFREMLNELDPTVAGDMLVPWLQRSALQKVEGTTKGWGGKALDATMREIRKRTGLQIMTANVVNTLQQFTGLTIGMVKMKPSSFRNALWDFVRHPGQVAEDISDKSVYMRNRMSAKVMEIQSTLDDILLNPSKYDQARDFATKHGYFLQQHTQGVVDHVVWLGAYNEAVENGETELEAIRQADSAVRETQGSFAPEDVSRFESGTPFIRAFTMFYSYFNMQANLLGSEFTNIVRDMGLKKGAGRALYVYTFGFMLPAVLSEAIVRGMSGKDADQDDDGYLNDIMDLFFGAQFRTASAMVPGVGPAVNMVINKFNNKWYDDRITSSPAVSMIESAGSAPFSAYKAVFEDGNKKKAIKDSMTLLGMLSGLPAAPLARPIGYLSDVADGNKNPENPLDFARGLATGK